MVETVLVTSGTGFVAGWCIVELLRRGYVVRTTVRSLSKETAVRTAVASATDASDRLTFFAADLTRDEGWDAALAGCDYVLHVASPVGGVGGGPRGPFKRWIACGGAPPPAFHALDSGSWTCATWPICRSAP